MIAERRGRLLFNNIINDFNCIIIEKMMQLKLTKSALSVIV